MKRVVIISDTHCGHRIGLTPPVWQQEGQYGEKQKVLWGLYVSMLNKLKPIDVLIVNGDCVDGKGRRSGGSELITADRFEQVEMAYHCIVEAEAKDIVMTYGTAYHTGNSEDWERSVADKVGAKQIAGQVWPCVEGITFDCKHKPAGTTTVPYTKGTGIAKDRLWNYLWNEFDEQPKADIIVRSHAHYFYYSGEDQWLGIITPALQGQGSKFGSRICTGHVDFGLVYFDCENGGYSWGWDIVRPEVQKQEILKL